MDEDKSCDISTLERLLLLLRSESLIEVLLESDLSKRVTNAAWRLASAARPFGA